MRWKKFISLEKNHRSLERTLKSESDVCGYDGAAECKTQLDRACGEMNVERLDFNLN